MIPPASECQRLSTLTTTSSDEAAKVDGSVAHVRFKIAVAEADKLAVFQLRYQVLVETDGYYQENSKGMIDDRYDRLPTTTLITAWVGMAPCSACCQRSKASTPTTWPCTSCWGW